MRQLRLVRVSVNISKISIAVKFPCSLKVHLRSDQESVTTSGTYPLKEGLCQVNEKLEVQIQAIYDTEKRSYNEVAIILATTIASSNSNIPAGMATFYPFLRQQGIETHTIESLQKCSDRVAKIYFGYSWKDLRKIKDLQNQHMKSSKAMMNLNKGLLKNSSFNRFTDKDEGLKSISKQKEANGALMTESRVKAYNNQPGRFSGQSTLQARERVKTNATYNNYNNESNQRRENALKSEVEMLNIEVEKYKQKCRNYERKERELNMTIKDMKENIEKKKTKVLETESMKAQVEMGLGEKEKQLKESRLQNKKLQQKLDDLNMSISTMEKRLEIKEKGFDEEVRLYLQKMGQLEKDINKKTFEYNSLLEKMELTEKNSQLNMKDKEKRNLEEKTQLIKKVQLLGQQIEKLKQTNDEKDLKLSNLTLSHKTLISQEAGVRNELHKLEANYEVLKAEFANERSHRVALEREIEALSAAQNDKNIFKKKYNESFQQLSKTNEKHERLQALHNQLLLKFNESEQKLKDATKTNKQLIIQTGQLSTEVENLKKQNSSLSSEFNSLSAKNQMLNQKLNDLRSKLEAEKQQLEDMQGHYEDRVNYLVKTKEYVQSQVEDWKQKHEKQQNLMRQLEAKSKHTNDQLLSRHEEYLKMEESNKKNLQSIQELNRKIQRLKQQIQAAQKKEKLLHQSLKSKGNDAYELQKKLNEHEQEIYILQEKVQTQAKESHDKQAALEKNIQDKDKTINQNYNLIAELKNELVNLEQELEKTMAELGTKKKELVLAEDTIREHLQTIGDHEKKIEDLNRQLELTQQRVSCMEEELDNARKKRLQLDQDHKSLNQRWNHYRQSTTNALQQLLDQIGLDEPTTRVELLKFPDSSLSTMQINALKHRNELLTKYRLTVGGLEEQLQVYKKELEKVKALTSAKQTELDDEILELKSRQSRLHEEWMAEKSQLSKVISSLQEQKQEVLSESERLKSSISHLQQINSQLTSQKCKLQQQIQHREQQISLLNDQILQLKSQQIRQKSSSEYSLKQYKQQQQIQMQKIKQTLTETCERLLQEQRKNQEKQARITDLENRYGQVTAELARQVNRKLELEGRLKQADKQKDQLRTLVNYRDKTIEDLYSDLASRNLEVEGLLEKQALLQTERKQTYQALTDTQVMKEKLQKALELEKDSSFQLKTQLNDLLAISSSSNEEATKRIKEQKDQLTKLESELQLKSYVINQFENLRVQNQTQIKELIREFENKKQTLQEAGQHIEQLKNSILKLSESQASTHLELQALQDQNSTNLQKITQLENHLAELMPKAEQLVIRLEEIIQLNKKINSLEDELHKASLQLQAAQNEVKNVTGKMINKEEEYRKKIINLETDIAQKQMEFKDSQTKSVLESEREKAQLMKELEEQDKAMRDQQLEAKFRIDQLQNEIESLNQDCLELSNLLNEKEEEVLELEQNNEECERKISDLNGELKACLEAWDKEKAAYLPSRKQMNDLQSEMGKFQDYASELDTKTKQLLEISRKKGSEESKFGVTELLRDLSTTLSKSKVKILNKVESEDEKDAIITEYKQLQEKIDTAMRSQNSIYK